MQLYALDQEQLPILARNAVKQTAYTCPECAAVVHVRSGIHRQPHFYHVQSSSSCRQNGKGMVHLQIQNHLVKLLPNNEGQMEVRFPSIERIADVAWEKQKLIFEIQCSPISSEELLKRTNDYRSLGYETVWILHDHRYNQWRVSAAEISLRPYLYYFTNMNAEGKGIIYDQYDLIYKGVRRKTLPQLSVNLSNLTKGIIDPAKLPLSLQERFKARSFYFEGDLMDIWIKQLPGDYVDQLIEAEGVFADWKLSQQPSKGLVSLFKRFVITPYLNFFQMLLEKASK